MKVVYISPSVIPSRRANSIQVMKMCQAFARNGHDVTLLAQHAQQSGAAIHTDVFQYYGVDEVFEVRRLQPLNIGGHGFFTYGLLCGTEVLKIAPDLVYGRDLTGTLCSTLLGYDAIYEIHRPNELAHRRFRWLVKSKSLQHIVVISEALRHVIEGAVGAKPIIVAHDGADLPCAEDGAPAHHRNFRESGEEVGVGYVGHLYPGKGGELIVSLAARLPNVTFHVIGGYEADIGRVAEGAPENVIFHGFSPPSEIPVVLSDLDIMLLPPSRRVTISGVGDISGFMSPLKLFEYMAAGKAIIASDLTVLREVLQDERNALLVPPENVGRWKQALVRLIDDEGLRKRLGTQARDDLRENYLWSKRAQKVLAGAGNRSSQPHCREA